MVCVIYMRSHETDTVCGCEHFFFSSLDCNHANDVLYCVLSTDQTNGNEWKKSDHLRKIVIRVQHCITHNHSKYLFKNTFDHGANSTTRIWMGSHRIIIIIVFPGHAFHYTYKFIHKCFFFLRFTRCPRILIVFFRAFLLWFPFEWFNFIVWILLCAPICTRGYDHFPSLFFTPKMPHFSPWFHVYYSKHSV